MTDTALFAAIDAGRIEEVRALLDAGADPNTFTLADAADPASRLPALYRASITGNAAIVKLLLERGAEPNDGESIYHAAELDHREVLGVLVAGGADPSGRHSHWGNTPLYFLAGYHRFDEKRHAATSGMRWLLEHGADPNVTSGEIAETPLHKFASEGRDPEALALLLDHGAHIETKNADGKTAYMLAVRCGAQQAAEFLERRGASAEVASEDRFLGACRRGDTIAARALLDREPALLGSLAIEDRWAGIPLHHAAWVGDVGAVRTLLALGSPINVRDRVFGSNPLGWAAHGSGNCRSADDDYIEVVGQLIAAGADREHATNRWGEPPESMASAVVRAVLDTR
jgi:ankyrin repeat protein